jgi:Uma2 family endonuclease
VTAEPTGHVMWSPDPIRQRLAVHTIEDVLNLPDDAPRVELSNGVMIVVPSPTLGHQFIGNLLWSWLAQHAPEQFAPATAVGVAVNVDSTLEPDVLLLRRPLVLANHFVMASQVVIAIEVVSAGTKRRDRLEKPAQYAEAGIPHFWRIEQDPIHVFAYDLVKDRYEPVGDSAEELVLKAPFDIRLPIRDIAP